MKKTILIFFGLCILVLSGHIALAGTSNCKVKLNDDNLGSSSTLRYIVQVLLNGRTDQQCLEVGSDDGTYEQSISFENTTNPTQTPIRNIVLSSVLEFDIYDNATDDRLPILVGNTSDKPYALIDGSGVSGSPFACKENSGKVTINNLVILANGIDQPHFFKDCLVEGEQVFVCDVANNVYDATVIPGEEGWCGGGGDDTDDDTYLLQIGEAFLPINIKYADVDSDGYGDPNSSRNCYFGVMLERLGKIENASDYCEGYVGNKLDCDDANWRVHPRTVDRCNGYDDNCDGRVDEGFDVDGDGVTTCEGDCDDGDSAVYPGAEEDCDDGFDNNCNGLIDDQERSDCTEETITTTYYEDKDGDGYGDAGTGVEYTSDPGDGYTLDSSDCDDSEATIHPGAAEICGDGIDQDCSDGDLSCSVEICDSGVDNDGDGLIGCDDPDCITDPLCSITVQETECADGIDNDSDGSIDCADSDCYNVVIDEATGTTCASMSVGIVGDGGDVVGGADVIGGCSLNATANSGPGVLGILFVMMAFFRNIHRVELKSGHINS